MPTNKPQQSIVPHYAPAKAASTDKTKQSRGRGAITQIKVRTTGGKGSNKNVTKLVKVAGKKRFVVKK